MPYVVDCDTLLHRPAKRRKLITELGMARRKSNDEQDAQTSSRNIYTTSDTNGPTTADAQWSQEDPEQEIRTSNREELIECIKRGEKPTWVPSANLQALCDSEIPFRPPKQAHSVDKLQSGRSNQIIEDPFFSPWTEAQNETLKPRSAYHRGDFNGFEEPLSASVDDENAVSSTTSPVSLSASSSPPPWLGTFDSSPIGRAVSDPRTIQGMAMASISRKRTPSLGSSLSSSFVLRTPTSPLVHAVNNVNLDNDSRATSSINATTADRSSRRQTMPPNAFQSFSVLPADATPPNFSRPFLASHRDTSARPPSHQPRRSLGSFTYQPSPSPQNTQIRTRRLSLATEFSARRRTSMVGSFEESILRGRMSSPASQPFDFVAQIGVMGKGDCPPSLKCPAHVIIPFQAVFYHYPSSTHGRSVSDDAPSPYVGTIDLEHNLKPVQISAKRKRSPAGENPAASVSEDPRAPENTPIGKALARDAEMQKYQTPSLPKMSLGGAYRVPQKGQLQIIIKNQNKTAVKLFLVPYDLEDMDAGTKTFVRQRSYSCGPILDASLNSTAGCANLHDPLRDKHILRYLIHIRFCCPAKGRYYLHDQMRVVFANRVPDGKEKLENELQLPQPKYTPFRPHLQRHSSSQQSAEDYSNMTSRYSQPVNLVEEPQPMDSSFVSTFALLNPIEPSISPKNQLQTANAMCLSIDLASRSNRPRTPTEASHSTPITHVEEKLSSPQTADSIPSIPSNPARALSPVQGFLPSTSTRSSPIPWGSSSTSSTVRSFSPAPVEVGNGLLSRQFRTLYRTSSSHEQRQQPFNSDSGSISPELTKNDHATSGSQDISEFPTASTQEEHIEQGDISLSGTG